MDDGRVVHRVGHQSGVMDDGRVMHRVRHQRGVMDDGRVVHRIRHQCGVVDDGRIVHRIRHQRGVVDDGRVMHRIRHQRGVVNNGCVMHRVRHQRGVVHLHHRGVMHYAGGEPTCALYAAQPVHSIGAARGDVQQRDGVALSREAVHGMQPYPRHSAAVARKGTVLHRQQQHPQRRVVLPCGADDVAVGSLRERDVAWVQREVVVRVPHVHLQGRDGRIVVKHDVHLRHRRLCVGIARHIQGVGLVALHREGHYLHLVPRVVGINKHPTVMGSLDGAVVADMQRVATVVVHRQRQGILQLPATLDENHAVHHQRCVAGVAHQQGGRSRLGDGRVSQVHTAVAAQVGAVDAHRAGIHGRQHVAPHAVAQGGIQ